MEEGIQWYPLPEVKSPEDNWDHISSTASKPQHTHTQKYTSGTLTFMIAVYEAVL